MAEVHGAIGQAAGHDAVVRREGQCQRRALEHELLDHSRVRAIDEQGSVAGGDQLIATPPCHLRHRDGMTLQRRQRRACGVEQQHVLAGGECQLLAIAAPAKAGRPARRTMQHLRRRSCHARVPQADRAILTRAGQPQTLGLPRQLEHARRMLAQQLRGTGRGIDQIQPALAATDGELPSIRRPGQRRGKILDICRSASLQRCGVPVHRGRNVRPGNPGIPRADPRGRACAR